MFPKLIKAFVRKVLEKDPSLASLIPHEVDRTAKAPARDCMTYDTLDSYMNERLRDSATKCVLYTIVR